MLICTRAAGPESSKTMSNLLKILRAVADPNRLRILLLLRGEELSVAELQEILTMGQSTISTHLSQLKQASLVEDRRTGKNSLYRLTPADVSPLNEILSRAAHEVPEAPIDQAAMRRVVKKRQDKMRIFFDSVAAASARTTFPANPGRAWPKRSSASCRPWSSPTSAPARGAPLFYSLKEPSA